MRILRSVIVILVTAALLASSCAMAEGTYYGNVVCERTETLLAPFGGAVADMTLRKGDLIHSGDPICTVETSFVYSPIAGTVSAVFGSEGDSTEDVKTRRGGVVYIVPENKFSISASTEEAAKNSDCYVSVGQTVWLRKGRARTPVVGTGLVTAVGTEMENSGSYTVEIVSGGFAPDESVSIYRREAAETADLLGFGTVKQTPPVIISGEGSILRMHVTPGSEVSRGSLLFETVTGVLKKMKGADNRIQAKTDGIVASVEISNGMSIEQGSTLITLYPLDAMTVCISVPETSLALLPAGQKVYLTFGNGEEQEGTVESIDYLADVDENEQQPSVGYANYKVYISFEKKEGIRQGMLVTVDLPEPEAEPAAADNQ